MATTPGFSYAHAEESAVHHLLHLQLPDSADLFQLADACTAYVSVLVETDDAVTFATLCERLLAALKRLREWRKNSSGYCMIWSGCWRNL